MVSRCVRSVRVVYKYVYIYITHIYIYYSYIYIYTYIIFAPIPGPRAWPCQDPSVEALSEQEVLEILTSQSTSGRGMAGMKHQTSDHYNWPRTAGIKRKDLADCIQQIKCNPEELGNWMPLQPSQTPNLKPGDPWWASAGVTAGDMPWGFFNQTRVDQPRKLGLVLSPSPKSALGIQCQWDMKSWALKKINWLRFSVLFHIVQRICARWIFHCLAPRAIFWDSEPPCFFFIVSGDHSGPISLISSLFVHAPHVGIMGLILCWDYVCSCSFIIRKLLISSNCGKYCSS